MVYLMISRNLIDYGDVDIRVESIHSESAIAELIGPLCVNRLLRILQVTIQLTPSDENLILLDHTCINEIERQLKK